MLFCTFDCNLVFKYCSFSTLSNVHVSFSFPDLNRQKLVALAILLGCDYLPQGVPGIGKEISMRLMKNVHQGNLIDR